MILKGDMVSSPGGATTPRRYVIMANGQGIRWNDYLGIPKHLISIGDETLLERIIRQVNERDAEAEIIISSSDPRCESPGATRHSPLHNEIELDRFVPELLCDSICFLYGDTYYTDEAMDIIFTTEYGTMTFFGTKKSLVAIKAQDHSEFSKHLDIVRSAYMAGDITSCKGWQVFRSYSNLPLEGGPVIANEEMDVSLVARRSSESDTPPNRSLIRLSDETCDFNWPHDLSNFILPIARHYPSR